MQREISLLEDVVSLWRLLGVLRQLKPDIVNAHTPKAGLLGMLAAWLGGVPIRIYTLHGLRAETVTGAKLFILKSAERIASGCAHRVVCVSRSVREVYARLGLASAAKTLALDSVNGVDAELFLADDKILQRTETLREQLAIPRDAPVIGFVGRYTRDKGIVELLDAFEKILCVFPDARLVLLGRFEKGDPVPSNYVRRLKAHPQIILAGFVADTAPYYHLMDVLAFPTYREGFPTVVLEAGAAGIPVVGFRATGVVDAVVDGETGVLVPKGDSDALARASIKLVGDAGLREKLGKAAKARVLRGFAPERIWEGWLELYKRELASRERD
jgi:glycosyltransferase involved in cell wall biosynthesis